MKAAREWLSRSWHDCISEGSKRTPLVQILALSLSAEQPDPTHQDNVGVRPQVLSHSKSEAQNVWASSWHREVITIKEACVHAALISPTLSFGGYSELQSTKSIKC